MSSRKLPPLSLATLTALLVGAAVIALYGSMGQSFRTLEAGYAQHLFGVSSLKSSAASLGGVVVLQDGTVIAPECKSPTKLHVFDPSNTYTKNDALLHQETVTGSVTGGCGLVYWNVGGQDYLFSPINDASSSDGDGTFGIARIAWPSLAVTKMGAGAPANAIAIAIDPVTGFLVYAGSQCRLVSPLPATCPLYSMDPSTGIASLFMTLPGATSAFVGGLAFDPGGQYLFIANRTASPKGALDVWSRAGVLLSHTPLNTDPVGMGFHTGGGATFVVTNDQDGTITRFDFPGDNFALAPAPRLFASGGSRGDQSQAGPDGCLYVTQLQTRYTNGTPDSFNSIVQVCGGFAPPPGITPNPPPPPSSLCGVVYNDANDNGTRDAGEAPIGGVTINLSGADYLDLPVTASTSTSAADGAYCFNNLAAGTYSISEAQPNAYIDGTDTQGTPGTGTAGNDAFTNIALAAGVNGADNNFGELRPSSLGGYVYLDAGNDGIRSSGESGLAGVTVALTGTDDRGAAVTMSATTGGDGAYLFTNLRPGVYTIAETQLAPYLDGKDTQGTPGTGTAGNDVFSGITLRQDVNGRDNNFGERVPSSDLSVTGTAPATATAGGTFTYVMRAINGGTSESAAVVLAAAMPAGMRASAIVGAPAGWTCTIAPSGAGVTCQKPTVAVSESAAVSITVDVACPFPNPAPAGSNITATVSSTTPDPNPANNTAVSTLSVVNPAPSIQSLAVDKPMLWPPNHKMVPIAVNYTVTPACGGTPTVDLHVSCNERNTPSDWRVKDPHHLDVRSERLGTQKEGRVYTITVTATDPTGAKTQQEVTVTVPHDMGNGNGNRKKK